MRILERIEEIYGIGGGPGANRPGYSAGEDEAPSARGDEYPSFLVEATVTGVEHTIYTNVPNDGLVEGLGDGVVEVSAIAAIPASD